MPLDRYARQTVLPKIGEEGQRKLQQSSVLVVGAGGLGCPALQYLVAAGVGHVGIIDADTVEETNLQRQVLYREEDIGKNKAEIAKERLQALNTECRIDAYAEKLTIKNAARLFEYFDVILDGTDNFAAKFLINDAAVKLGKPFIYGSILGFEGQVSVFNYKGGPCYRCLFAETPKNDIPNCAEAGVIGALAGIVGSMQAMEAIKLLVGLNTISGTVITFDARDMVFKSFELPKDKACTVCSKSAENISIKEHEMVQEISVAETKDKKNNVILIDVREQHEWDAGYIDGAQHVALSKMLQGYVPEIDRSAEIILYCKSGRRSVQAGEYLESQGFENVASMAGGIEAW
ncbi:MAG: molybdopterin-synthase adenylyltransferase MoeB [Alphaproteobacteria bacterium]|nr:molybdopterin-synthase adenylyltransferase MoeB [Alphaproteobacteria bacterium]